LDGTKEIASYQNAWVELTYAWTTLTSAYQKAKLGWSVEQKASPVYSWAECVKYSSRLESLNGIAQTEDTNFNNWGTGTGTKHIAILFERSNDQIKFQFKLNPQDNWGSFKTWYTYYAISSSLMNYYGRTDFSYDPTKITQSYEINQSKSPGATFDYAEHEIWVNLDFINIPVETVEL
jgi:hypothetical protein